MPSRSLRTLTSIFLTCAPLSLACNGGSGTTDASTSDATTTSASTGTTGEPTTGSTTGESTTTPTTSGDSEAMTGSTSDATTGSTGPVITTGDATTGSTGDDTTGSTGDDTTGTTGSTGSTGDDTTGGAANPVSFVECQGGDADLCPAEDPACLVVEGPGGFRPGGSFFVTWSYCTRECDSDADCVSGPQGGTAKARCLPKGANDVKVCVLDCSFGKTCPDSLACSNDDSCGTKFCDCEGSGCDDFLCTE